MAYRTVLLKGDPLRKELIAAGTITPGMLIERTSSNTVQAHSGAGQNAQRLFAVEDDLQGKEIGENYSAANAVQFHACRPGDEVYAILATSQTVVIGDFLESAGNGYLRKHTASSAGAIEYPEAIVGTALTAVTTTSAVARIVVEVM